MSDRCYVEINLMEDQRELWEPIVGDMLSAQDADGGAVVARERKQRKP